LLVKLQQGLGPDQQADAVLRCGGEETSSVSALRLHTVAVAAESLDAALACYQADPEVERVEVNRVRQAEGVPNDEYYFDFTGGSGQWHLPQIGWDSLFGTLAPLGTATVAVLDTGVDAAHPELANKLSVGMSVFDASQGLTDPNGHGTWLAGIVAAATDNAVGVAGVA
jgi:subtilisin family serine protease